MASVGDWEELYSDKYKKKYWRNKNTKETTWKDPTKVDTGEVTKIVSNGSTGNEWEELYSEKYQKKYWRNKNTKETTWKDPNTSEIKVTTAVENNNIVDSNASVTLWEELYSEKYKKKYWRHKTTKEVSWKDPNETDVERKEPDSAIITNQPVTVVEPSGSPSAENKPVSSTSTKVVQSIVSTNRASVKLDESTSSKLAETTPTNRASVKLNESTSSKLAETTPTNRASVKLNVSTSSKLAETAPTNRTSVYRESISISKEDNDEMAAIRVESMNEDNNWILRYTSLIESWGKVRRKHWYHKVTKEITLISPYILDDDNDSNELTQGSGKSDEYVPKKIEELAPFFGYLELGNQGVRMGKRRGAAGATPKQDSLSYLSVQKRWIYFDWATDNVAEWRLVYTKRKLEYKMKLVTEKLSIPYLCEEAAIIGNNSSEVTKHVLIKDISHVFLEPSPCTSFRIYTNSKDLNDNLIQLTCPTYDDAIAWVEGIRYVLSLLSLNSPIGTGIRDAFLTKEATRVNERRKSRIILGIEEDISAVNAEKDASGDEVVNENTFQRFVTNTIMGVKKLATLPPSNLTTVYDASNRPINEEDGPTKDVKSTENNGSGSDAVTTNNVDVSISKTTDVASDSMKPVDNLEYVDGNGGLKSHPKVPVTQEEVATNLANPTVVNDNIKPKTKLSYISNLLKGKSKPVIASTSPPSSTSAVTSSVVAVAEPDHMSNEMSSAEKKKKAFKIKFNRHRVPPAKITSSDAGQVVDMLLSEDNAYRSGTISLQSRYSSQPQGISFIILFIYFKLTTRIVYSEA